MSLNKVMLIGNVGAKPEVRYIDNNPNSGQNAKVATFRIATSERYRDRDGNPHENTEWHNIVAWRGLADVIERYVDKGTQIFVEGHLRTRSYVDKTGATKYTTEIIADNIELLGKRQDNPASQGGYRQNQGGYQQNQGGYQQNQGGYQQNSPSQSTQAAPAPQIPSEPESPQTLDDLPF